MRVCVLTSSYPLGPGDMTGWFVHEQCRHVAEREEVDVTVLAPGHPDAPGHERQGRLDVRRLSYFYPRSLQRLAYGAGILSNLRSRPMAWVGLPAFLAAFAWGVVRHGRKADVVHAHWGPMGTVAVLTRWLHRRPVVLSVRGSDITGQSRLVRRVTAWTVRHSDAVSANTPVSHRAARESCTDDDLCRYIPNGVFLPPLDELDAVRAGRTDGEVRVVSVGRLVAERRYDLLIRAMSELKRRHPEVTLTLVGDGPERRSLETLAEEQGLSESVHFAGQVPRHEVSCYLMNADVYASATESDNFANAVLEAAAHGLPVVATRVGFPAEVVIDGESGRLVEPGDEEALCEALSEMTAQTEYRLEAGRRMRRRVEELGLTWEACAARTVELYRLLTMKTGGTDSHGNEADK